MSRRRFLCFKTQCPVPREAAATCSAHTSSSNPSVAAALRSSFDSFRHGVVRLGGSGASAFHEFCEQDSAGQLPDHDQHRRYPRRAWMHIDAKEDTHDAHRRSRSHERCTSDTQTKRRTGNTHLGPPEHLPQPASAPDTSVPDIAVHCTEHAEPRASAGSGADPVQIRPALVLRHLMPEARVRLGLLLLPHLLCLALPLTLARRYVRWDPSPAHAPPPLVTPSSHDSRLSLLLSEVWFAAACGKALDERGRSLRSKKVVLHRGVGGPEVRVGVAESSEACSVVHEAVHELTPQSEEVRGDLPRDEEAPSSVEGALRREGSRKVTGVSVKGHGTEYEESCEGSRE
eukprot:1703625-Rhodomonas_salina.4